MTLESIEKQIDNMRTAGADESPMTRAGRVCLEHASGRLAVCKGNGASELSDCIELAGALNDAKMYAASIQVYLMALERFRTTSRERHMIVELIGVVLNSLGDESVVERENAVAEYYHLVRTTSNQHAWYMGLGIMLLLQQTPAIEEAAASFKVVREMIGNRADKEEWDGELRFWENYVACMRECSVGLEST